jgi:septal ring factor EnvC (AmiA/AmiB activator)
MENTMKKMLKMLATPALALLIAAPAFAADPAATPKIDQRIQNQEKRIEQGEKSGALTGKEAARMEKREAKIESDVAKAKADGVVTKQERKHLNKELDNQSRKIHREKHDNQHR